MLSVQKVTYLIFTAHIHNGRHEIIEFWVSPWVCAVTSRGCYR